MHMFICLDRVGVWEIEKELLPVITSGLMQGRKSQVCTLDCEEYAWIKSFNNGWCNIRIMSWHALEGEMSLFQQGSWHSTPILSLESAWLA